MPTDETRRRDEARLALLEEDWRGDGSRLVKFAREVLASADGNGRIKRANLRVLYREALCFISLAAAEMWAKDRA